MKHFFYWLSRQPLELFFILGCVLVYFLLLPLVPIFDGDSFYYINHARQMLLRQDWLNTSTMMAKPVFVLWIAAAIYKLFSVNLFSTYLWHSIFVLGSLGAFYGFVCEIQGARVARLATMVLATALMFFYQSLSPMLDMAVVFFLILSHWFLYRFIRTGLSRWAMVAGLFMGLGFLTKGLMGVALPLMTFGFYMLASRQAPWRMAPQFGRAMLGMGLVISIVACIWLVPQFAVHGKQFGQLLYRENIERFFHPIDETGGERQVSSKTQHDPYMNILYLFLGFLPWSPLIIPALWQVYKEKYFGHKDSMLFLLSWFFIYLILSSLSGHYKGPRYLLPLFPPLAVIIGAYLERWLFQEHISFKRTIVWSYAFCTGVFVLLIGYVLATHFTHGEDQYKPIVVPILLLLGLTYALSWQFWRRDLRAGLSFILGSIALSYTGMLVLAITVLPGLLPEIALSKYCRETQITPVVWDMKIHALDLYVGKSLGYISRSDELQDLARGTYLLCQDKQLVLVKTFWQTAEKAQINDWRVVVLLRPVIQ